MASWRLTGRMDYGCRRARVSLTLTGAQNASRTGSSTTKPTRIASTATPSSRSIRTGAACCGWEPRMRGLTSSISGSNSSSIYRHRAADPNSLSPGRVKAIHQDPDGVLWVGFFPRALDRLDRKTGQIIHYLPGGSDEKTLGAGTNVNSIYRDPSGYLWVGGGGSGLDRFDERTGRFKHYRHDPARSPQLDLQQRLHDLWRPKRPDVGGPAGRYQPLRSRDGQLRQLPAGSGESGQPGQYGVGDLSRSFGRAVGRHVGRRADPFRRTRRKRS